MDPGRSNPYGGFNFRVRWSAGVYVAGVSEVSALAPTAERANHHVGDDPSASHDSLGRTKCMPVTLKRGVIHDAEFEQWARAAWNTGSAQGPGEQCELKASPHDFRRELTIDVFDEAGRKVLSYKIHRAWVSELVAPTHRDTNANAFAIESMRIEHEGCEIEMGE